jgi:hypothetical protein
MELPPYQYDVIKNKRSIRVLHLQPGFKFLPLKLSLSTISLDEHPHSYAAVSYVWGDASVKFPISCDGKRLEITRNLQEALEQFRDEDHPRVLWADAICINQNDLEERASQVQLMWDVYALASHCLIYLGKPAAETLTAVNLMTDLVHEISRSKVGNRRTSLPKDGDFNDMIVHQGYFGGNYPPLESPEWQPLLDFFDRPYFGRIWVRLC